MSKFGQGKYVIASVYDRRNIEHNISDLSDRELIRILSNHGLSSIERHIKALLYKINLEFRSNLKTHREFFTHRAKNKIIVDTSLQETINQKTYFHISLPQIGQVPSYSQEFCDPQGNRIASVRIISSGPDAPPEILIFSDKPLILSGSNSVYALHVYTTEALIIHENLKIEENLFIHAKSLFMRPEHKICSRHIILECEQLYDIAGTLEAENIEIKAGHYQGKGIIEANQLTIIAEEADHYLLLKAKETLNLVSMQWTDHPGSMLHAPGQANIRAIDFYDASLLTVNRLSLLASNATLAGRYYLGIYHMINTELLLKIEQNALFLCNGQVKHQSDIVLSHSGQFYYCPDIEISGNLIKGPELVQKNQLLNDQHPIFLASSCLYPNRDQTPVILLQAGRFAELKGNMLIHDANFTVTSEHLLEITAHIWQKSSSQALFTRIQAPKLNLNNSKFKIDYLALATKNPVELKACDWTGVHLKTYFKHDLIIEAKTAIRFNIIEIDANDIRFQKDSIIESSDTFILKGRKVANHTKIKANRFEIEADHYFYNRGIVDAKASYFTAPLLLSTGRVIASECLANSFASAFLGFNKVGSFNNDSIISVSPLLTLQNAICPPSRLTCALAFANTGLTVAGLLAPPVLPIFSIIKYTINSAAQMFNAYHKIKAIKQSIGAATDRDTTANKIRLITSICQAGMILGYSTHSAVVNGQTLTQLTAWDPHPSFGAMTEAVVDNLSLLVSGTNNVSVINLNPGLFLGLGSTNYALFNLNAGAMLGLTHSNNSFYNLDSGFGLTLGPRASTGFSTLVCGHHHALFGKNIINYHNVVLSPLTPLPLRNWSITSHKISIKKPLMLDHSSLMTHRLKEHCGLSLNQSHLRADELLLNSANPLYADQSHIELNRCSIEKDGMLEAHQSHLSCDSLDNQGKMLVAGSQIKLKQFNNGHQAQWISSQADVGSLTTQANSMMAFDNCNINLDSMNNAKDAEVTLRSSWMNANRIENQGVYQLNDSTSTSHVFRDQGIISVDNSLFYPEYRDHLESTITAFMSTVPQLVYQPNGLFYQTLKDYKIHNRTVHSLLPIAYSARNITLDGKLEANVDFTLLATQTLNFNHANFTGTNANFSAGDDVVSLLSEIKADNLFLNSLHSNIDLIASKCTGTNYLGIAALEGNINLSSIKAQQRNTIWKCLAAAFNVRSQNTWPPTVLIGGPGQNHQGNGIELFAGKDVNAIYAEVYAQGNNTIKTGGSVTLNPIAYQYVSSVQEKQSFLSFNTRTVVTTDFKIFKSILVSLNGKNIIDAYDITSISTEFISQKGNDFTARNNMKLFESVLTQQTNTYRSSFWGATEKNKIEHTAYSVPTVVINTQQGQSHISAGKALESIGTFFMVKGKMNLFATDIALDNSRQQHWISTSSRNISFSVFGIALGGPQSSFRPSDPTASAAKVLLSSQNAVEVALNSLNTATSLVQAYTGLQSALNQNQWMPFLTDRLGLSLMKPQVTVTLSRTMSKTAYQTVFGGLFADNLVILAKHQIDIAIPMNVTENMSIAASVCNITAPELHYHAHSKTESLSVSPNADGKIDVGGSLENADMKASVIAPLAIQVGGSLELDIDRLNVIGQLDVGELKGEVRNKLSVITPLSSSKSTSSRLALDTRGQIQYSASKNDSTFFSHKSEIRVRHGLDSSFKATQIQLQDAVFAGDSQQSSVPHYKSSQHGFIFNSSEIQKALESLSQSPFAEFKHRNSDKISDAVCLSRDVYDVSPHPCGYTPQARFNDAQTGMQVVAYENKEIQQAVIAFRGTAEFKNLRADAAIALGQTPAEMNNPAFKAFMAAQIKHYQTKGFEVMTTGHSLGATLASIASSDYHLPAIVFDNIGIAKKAGYNLSQVLSMQPAPHTLNQLSAVNGIAYDYGTIVQLPVTPTQQAYQAVTTATVIAFPSVRFFAGALMTTNTHRIVNIEEQVKMMRDKTG